MGYSKAYGVLKVSTDREQVARSRVFTRDDHRLRILSTVVDEPSMRVRPLLAGLWEVRDGSFRDVREWEGFVDAVEVLFVALFEEEEDARVAHDAGADGAFVEATELLDDADDPAVVLAHAFVELASDAVAIGDGEKGAEFF